MSKYPYEECFRLVTEDFDNAEDFVRALWEWPRENPGWLYRGQISSEWVLLPAIFRGNAQTDYQSSMLHQSQLIFDYFFNAQRHGLEFPFSSPNPLEWEAIKWSADDSYVPSILVAHAQHHGVRTELLDITLDPLVAAFFAAWIYPYKFASLGIEMWSSDVMARTLSSLNDTFHNLWNNCQLPDKAVVWSIKQQSLPQTALVSLNYTTHAYFAKSQKALFLWNKQGHDEIQPFEEELRKLASDKDPRSHIFRWTIPIRLYDDLLVELKTKYGISLSKLFPRWETLVGNVRSLAGESK